MAKTKSNGGYGKGLIQGGGDSGAYLGHFRDPKVMAKGHNQGMPPVGPAVPAVNRNTMPSPAVTPAPAPAPNRNVTAPVTPAPKPVGNRNAMAPAPAPRPAAAPPMSRPFTPGPATAGAAGMAPALGKAAKAIAAKPKMKAPKGPKPVSAVSQAKRAVRTARKTGGDVGAAKKEVKTLKGERRGIFKTLDTAKAGSPQRKAAKEIAKSRFSGAFKARGK